MTDRELLELAAKAAGIQDGNWLGDGSYWVGAYDGGCEWNPLTDDGDALRLAIELGMRVEIDIECEDVCAYTHAQDGRKHSACENFSVSKDRFAATRRAIVSAAAEIGKGMR